MSEFLSNFRLPMPARLPARTFANAVTAGRRQTLLLSAAIAALVCVTGTAQPARAQSYSVGTASDLTAAMTTANTNNDYFPNITLLGDVMTPSGTVVPTGTSTGGSSSPNGLDIATGAFTLALSGAGTVWNAGTFGGAFDVDGSGSGGLTVSNGAQLVIPDTAAGVGFLSFNSGTLAITGSGSSVTTDYLAVGRGGDASIILTNGGQLTSSTSAIGECCGNTVAANITVLVDGAGTVWNAGYFTAGGATNNVDVTISNGGTIQTADGSGIGIDGTASMLVTGAGSGFVDSGTFVIGEDHYGPQEGHGTLTISGGAVVSASAVLMGVNDPGASGALTVNTNGILETGSLAPDVGSATVEFDNGTLRATAASTPGSDLISGFTPGNFTLGAGEMFLDSNGFDVTASSVMSGMGGLTKQGAGTLTLTADSTYVGGTTISAGTLQLGNGGTSGSIQGAITDNGILAFNRTDAVSFGGVISGSGAVNQIGSGTTTLTGISSYTGQTDIVAGQLQVAAGGQISGTATTRVDGGGLTVTGAGSAFTTPGDLLVGRGTGTAFVTVADGGHLTTGRSFIGESGATTTATALTATVTGAGSVWDAGDGFFLGAASGSASASLTISNGGMMRAQSAVSDSSIGIHGVALATVTDANSQLVVGGSTPLTIGELAGGAGTLTITNGGLVIAPMVLMGAFDAGASGILNLDGTPGTQGVLQTASLTRDAGGGIVNFDGGVLRASADNTGFLSGFTPGGIMIGAGGAFIDSNGFAVTASSGLSGSGALTKEGAGTLTLTDTSSYTGGTTIEAGTLQLGNGGTSGSIQGDVTNNGALAFDRADAVSFGGVVSGTGGVSQIGAGSTTLTAVNTYTGGTVISDGTLIGSATSFGSGAILDNAALVIGQPADASFANAINGTGSFVKQGAGQLNYTGTGNLSGPTTVAAGTLSVNGSLMNSVVTVQSGATLGGNGTVGATAILAGGTIAPGNSIGTLHINGAYSQASGGIYQVQVDPNSNASDLIAVNDAATLTSGAGINVTKSTPGDYRLGTIYTILTATNGVTGTYTLTGDTALTPYIGLKDSYDANNAYLKVVQIGDPATAAGTPNQTQTATGTDSLPSNSGVGSAVLNTSDPTDTRSAFDQLSGEALASAKSALVSGSLLVRDAALGRLRDTCSDASDQIRRPDDRAACPPLLDRPTLWGQGFGSWGHIAGNGNAAGLSDSEAGFLVGVDIPVYDWRLGYFGGFSRTDFNLKARNSSGNSNSYHLGLYGGTRWGDLGLRLGASYSWNDLATDRTVSVDSLSNDLHANYNAGTTQVFGEMGQRFTPDRFTFEPFANAAYVNLHTGGFSETGGDAALTARADTLEDTFITLGVRPSTDISWGSVNATVRGMAGWRHAFGDVTPSSTVSFAGSDTFTVTGAPIAPDAGVVEAGLDFTVHDNVAAGITYGGQFSSHETDHSIRGTAAITF